MNEQDTQAEIMVVDDSRETLQLLSRMLYKNGYDVRPMGDGQSAALSAFKNPPDLALIDISMSGMNGYELCSELKANPSTQQMPIIFVSALDDVRNKVKAFQVGADDYVLKPFKFQEVLARIEVRLRTNRKMLELISMLGQDQIQRDQVAEQENKSLEYMTHDLRNPLHAVALNLSLLKKQLRTTSGETDEYFERIERNILLMNQILSETSKIS